jgi:TonB family protein
MKTWIVVTVLACSFLTGCESTVGLYADAPVRNEVQLTGTFLRPEEVDQAPVAIKQTAPEFPSVMRKAGLDGKAFVILVVGADGQPQQVQVEQATHALFAEAAVAAVKKWQFKPATKAGQPVAAMHSIPIEFRRDIPGEF